MKIHAFIHKKLELIDTIPRPLPGSRYPGSPIILVSGDITSIPKFEGSHPEQGR